MRKKSKWLNIKALSNAKPNGVGENMPRDIGFTSSVDSSSTVNVAEGVSSEYVPQEGYNWYVLRVTYNRINKAIEAFKEKKIITYFPQHYVLKMVNGGGEEASIRTFSSQFNFCLHHAHCCRQYGL